MATAKALSRQNPNPEKTGYYQASGLDDKRVSEIKQEAKGLPAFNRMQVAMSARDSQGVKNAADQLRKDVLDKYRGTEDFNEAVTAVNQAIQEQVFRVSEDKKDGKIGEPSKTDLKFGDASKSADRGHGFAAFGLPDAA